MGWIFEFRVVWLKALELRDFQSSEALRVLRI